ncbi:hypothetical protein FYK55_05950 [Roseiconus nitratireducens]|uniref:Uncharacterized protein n=1 Tax=Roseiconus nitratireducens TaxID=2605748 RepID=A0A5M6DFT9_9BACT|nr:hypothetical protein [Roseiconus nitratireducens]KAA5545210.1 hypothetical protein FYK55_05950 [Roseiconus nitratireducens]
MLQDVIRAIDYSDFAEVALALFCLAFGLMCYATLRLSRSATDRFASIPLSDQVEDPRDE